MHLGTVHVGQAVRLRNSHQDIIASGKDFQVILGNQPAVNSLCKALAMGTHMLRAFVTRNFPLGIRKQNYLCMYGVSEFSAGLLCPVQFCCPEGCKICFS